MLDKVETDVVKEAMGSFEKMTPQETSVGRPNNSPHKISYPY